MSPEAQGCEVNLTGFVAYSDCGAPPSLYPPPTVAYSATDEPTVALVGSWVVLIDGVAEVIVTAAELKRGSAAWRN
jgi:hypothetical protein